MPLCLYHYVYSIVYIFCIQLSVNGHLSCLHDLAIMNSAAIKKKHIFEILQTAYLKLKKIILILIQQNGKQCYSGK